ncbi:MAG TPA: FkbM family methyltransferase [Polyangia bacterium]
MRLWQWLALGAALGAGAVGLLHRFVRVAHDERAGSVRVLDLPARVDGESELFATALGRVVVRSVSDGKLRFHRHAHEMWLPLDDVDATYSQGARWMRTRLSANQLLYTPPYAMHAWTERARLVVFVAAPEDDAVEVEANDPRLRDAADAVPVVLTEAGSARWMLDKLETITVGKTHWLGPYARQIALYVVGGRGEVRAGTVHPIGPRQLAIVAAGARVEIVASSPLRLLVFDPAHTTVSSILQEGTKRYSQDDEELVIRDFFHDRRSGFFVDVGAGHYQRFSTTFYLEEQLGWSGVAIDALSEYADDYRKHRPRTTFVNVLVTDKARGPQAFYRADDFPEVSSVSKQLAEEQAREFSDSGAVSARKVPSSTLDAVLDKRGVRAIDFLSMDIEEHEPAALAGFDIDRFHPAFVCIEAHPAVRDALWQYFRRHGYVRQDQYLAWDSSNWYFARP